MRIFASTLFALVGLTVISAVAAPAQAEYKFCNMTSYALETAIGRPDAGRIETTGWLRVRPGECRAALERPVEPGDYYVYAEAIPGHVGEQKVWAGDYPLCVGQESFTIRNHQECAGDGREERLFLPVKVDTPENGMWRTEFTEPADYKSVFRVEIAGVQRLLKDLGYEIGNIDGFSGDRTRVAIAAFKKSKGVTGPGLISDDLITALIDEANAIEKGQGFLVCNGATSQIWAAVAAPNPADGGAVSSRGWWPLMPEECAKVLKGAVAAGNYYVHATQQTPNGEVAAWGEDATFCVNTVLFDIGQEVSCDAQGFDEAGFRKIEVEAVDTWTYRFTDADFSLRPGASL